MTSSFDLIEIMHHFEWDISAVYVYEKNFWQREILKLENRRSSRYKDFSDFGSKHRDQAIREVFFLKIIEDLIENLSQEILTFSSLFVKKNGSKTFRKTIGRLKKNFW